ESNFEYLLVLDGDGRIIHTSRHIAEDELGGDSSPNSRNIKEIVTPSSWKSFSSSMEQAREGNRGIALFVSRDGRSIPLKTGYLDREGEDLYLFFGNTMGSLSKDKEWEKDERVKELTCIYNIAELIETSETVKEFFNKLPRYLSAGMLHPEEVVVYSNYDGVEYGQKPSSSNYISVKLTVWNQDKGEIQVGYHDDLIKLLPEEQKMLDEVGRMLNLALDRKELKEKVERMAREEKEYHDQLQELKEEIRNRTAELDKQKKKLSIVDSYLNRVNDGWDKAKSRLETIFRAIPDEVVLLDRNRKVVMTNREDIEPGDHCYSSLFDRESPCDDCRLARILNEKTPVTLTIKDGERYLQVHALPVFNKKHEVDGILEFYRDVTLEKTYEQQLQQADKLASIGELVSGIGHEINNPNQFIRGNIKIIKQSMEDMIPIVDRYYEDHPDLRIARLNYDFFKEHIMVLVEDMTHGSERIKSIVEGLRAFTKKDEGLLVDNVDINTLVEATTRLVYKEVHKRAEIELDLVEDLPAFKGNAQKIEQVLVNLIVNAGQAIPEDRKGHITVRTMLENGNIVVQVADNGTGMNETTMKQIFDPFFTTKRARGGTGLGLAIAFRIIDEHGGNISVNSRVGSGTTFTIKIPVEAPGRGEEGKRK
ncbi:MAG: ATP-binding protein, partial [Candidatus Krumholzibacteriota bacterium]